MAGPSTSGPLASQDNGSGDVLAPGSQAEFTWPADEDKAKVYLCRSSLMNALLLCSGETSTSSQDGVAGLDLLFCLKPQKNLTTRVKPGFSRRWTSGYKEPHSPRDGDR